MTARSAPQRLAGLLLAAATAVACHHEATRPADPPCSGAGCGQSAAAPKEDFRALKVRTYDGSGQAMHPDVAFTPPGWSARQRHLVVTPYPGGDPSYENPSIYAAPDEFAWNADTGVQNPVARPSFGYLSDPALVWVPETNELWMYYRQVADQNYIRVIRSSDGVRWSEPVGVDSAPNHQFLSPSVVHRGPGDWQMWSVNAGVGCDATQTWVERRTSTDGLTWSDPQIVHLWQSGWFPWHVDVIWVASLQQYWAIYNVKGVTGCATPALYLATSPDGVEWTTYPRPVIARGAIPEFADVVYRSTMAYDARSDGVRFWYSGARLVSENYVWSIATQWRARTKLFADLQTPPAPAPTPTLRLVPSDRLPPPERP